jgi:hypothetical protein
MTSAEVAEDLRWRARCLEVLAMIEAGELTMYPTGHQERLLTDEAERREVDADWRSGDGSTAVSFRLELEPVGYTWRVRRAVLLHVSMPDLPARGLEHPAVQDVATWYDPAPRIGRAADKRTRWLVPFDLRVVGHDT